MSNSQRALAASHTPPKPSNGVGEMPKHEQSLSEQYRLIGLQWVEADRKAKMKEELKSAELSKIKQRLMAERGDMADNRADRIARTLPEWTEYVTEMVRLRAEADALEIQKIALRMKHSEWIGRNADARAEMGLHR
jgi:hypothetical protein